MRQPKQSIRQQYKPSKAVDGVPPYGGARRNAPRLTTTLAVLVMSLARCEAFTGVTVTVQPSDPHKFYIAERSLDTASPKPNQCAGYSGCGLRLFAMSDLWGGIGPSGYETMDGNAAWDACSQDERNTTLGDVAQCLTTSGTPLTVTAKDFLPATEPVSDHALACLAYYDYSKHGLDPSKSPVHCAPVGGAISTCKFDAPALSGAFRASAGVINRAEVNLGAVNMSCDADITLVASAGGTDGGPITMVQGSNRDPRNVATVDLGAGEGSVLTIKAKQGVPTRINVKAFVSGNYEAGDGHHYNRHPIDAYRDRWLEILVALRGQRSCEAAVKGRCDRGGGRWRP